ncbi:MAG: thiamine-phosphate pyrophosphorylase [Candidatus Omnitrophica bacterium]|nr:thiamine-phosphate pyrophosphorylase [Candidatus Omnitrophota bacterium]MCF7877215.1 thiamine-phosphate pyrophosphorylase [Candidatus Omnitrophota bacterium]MCF7878078.1 thiamine-phosphate pyrophosphorylase [Candidatus Omnitrophota bacterium]MCF7892759.1 thiamine-phosphate pyrophosphorylase [Candidatus Omnitrophota bacterium]
MDKKNYLPIIDANFNRCKEGLRVAEDIFRFALKDDQLRKKIRNYRHKIVGLVEPVLIREAIRERDSMQDLGKKLDSLENKRDGLFDVLYLNLQRGKESLRVLEEFSKITDKKNTAKLKNLRYRIYDLEKEIILKWPSLSDTRHTDSR